MTNARKHPIYLDYSATTPVDPRVAEKMTHTIDTLLDRAMA